MARPFKEGLDFFPLDVSFFGNIKVRRLSRACGPNSQTILICLLCNIYENKGYYIEWNKDLPFLIADTIGVSEGAVEEVIRKAVQIEFFDKDVFDKYEVLTSESIQEVYLYATERRKNINWNHDYLADSIKNKVNEVNQGVNVNNNPVNDNRSTHSIVKDSIVIEKEKDTNVSKKKEDKSSSSTQSDFEKFNEWIKEHAPYCANPKNFTSQISEKEFLKLKETYSSKQIADMILQIENRKDLRKRYTNLYRTVLNWLKKEQPETKKGNNEQSQQKTDTSFDGLRIVG